METQLTYESAYAELQEIAMATQNETISVDQLAEKIKRAALLIEFCQSRLRSTEQEVNKIFSQLE